MPAMMEWVLPTHLPLMSGILSAARVGPAMTAASASPQTIDPLANDSRFMIFSQASQSRRLASLHKALPETNEKHSASRPGRAARRDDRSSGTGGSGLLRAGDAGKAPVIR